MRKFVLLNMIAAIGICSFAQDIDQKNVPAVILNAFHLKFANASDVDWELDKGVYHVDFEINDKNHEAWLDHKGTLLKHEQELWTSEIPTSVIATIKNNCEYFDMHDADKVEEGGNVTYYINFEINNKDHDFRIEEDGKLLYYRKELKKSEVPEAMLSLVQTRFGSLDLDDAVRKEEAGKVQYFLDGEINDKDHAFWFNASYKLALHRQDLRESEIPPAVIKTIRASYPEFDIRDADLEEEGNKTVYKIELRKSRERIKLVLSPKGDILITQPR